MGRSLALFTYKMRFFFGPALRGRFGPLAYLALILIFLPQGYAFGYAIGLSLLPPQVSVIPRIRSPRVPVRLLALPVIGLSLLPALGVAVPGLPIRFDELPLPSIAFAALGLAVLRATTPSLPDIAVAAAYLVAIAGVWLTYSKTYIFHGLKPTLTAGFGQVDFRSRMEMQRRIMARLGGVTTRIRLRTDRGSDTGLMTRFHLVRIWRDGSVVFVGLFALLVIVPTR